MDQLKIGDKVRISIHSTSTFFVGRVGIVVFFQNEGFIFPVKVDIMDDNGNVTNSLVPFDESELELIV